MFDKQIENKLKQAINNLDNEKLEALKKKISSGNDLNSMLNQVDVNKAQKKLSEMNMGNIDLNSVINQLKNNPDIIDELKKRF